MQGKHYVVVNDNTGLYCQNRKTGTKVFATFDDALDMHFRCGNAGIYTRIETRYSF